MGLHQHRSYPDRPPTVVRKSENLGETILKRVETALLSSTVEYLYYFILYRNKEWTIDALSPSRYYRKIQLYSHSLFFRYAASLQNLPIQLNKTGQTKRLPQEGGVIQSAGRNSHRLEDVDRYNPP